MSTERAFDLPEDYRQRLAATARAVHALRLELADKVAALKREEEILRQMALLAHERTGDTHPGPGVSVAVYTDIDYAETDAIAWARNHEMPHLIVTRIDRTAFDAMVKPSPAAFPFVSVKQHSVARIDSDLSKALAGGEE